MKKLSIMSLLLSFFAAGSIGAQNIESAIYFEPGKHELSAASQAELSKILENVRQHKDFDLDIVAFTDDIGEVDYNKALAERRAQAVKTFFDAAGIKPSDTYLKEVGELALTGNENIEEQRRRNRRVEIKATPFAAQSLSDFYNYNARRNRQQFRINSNRDTTVICRKGTQLFIPAKSLQLKGGGAVANEEIVLNIIESYSYQDMIFSNLSTISDNQLIETGGMVFIEAKTKDGRELEIKPGEELTLSMVSNKKLKEDMQLFYTDHEQPAVPQNINWQATNQPFVSTNFDTEVPTFNFAGIKMEKIKLIEKPNLPDWPERILTMPTMPVTPKKPELRPSNTLSKEETIAENPQKKGESDKKYEARIAEIMTVDERAVALNIKMNASAEKRYAKEVEEHKAAMVKYENALESYKRYEATIAEINNSLVQNSRAHLNWFGSFKWSEDFSKQLRKAVGNMRQFEDFKKYLTIECRRLDLKEELKMLEALSQGEQKAIKMVALAFGRCLRSNADFCENHHIDDTRARVSEWLNAKDPLANTKMAYESMMGTFRHAVLLNRLIENYNEVLDKSGFNAQAEALDALCSRLLEIQNKVVAIKMDRGLLSKKEAQTVFMNSTGINQLGWINCDRFTKYTPEELMALKVVDEKSAENVDMFVTFNSVTGVMKLNQGADKSGVFAAGGIPKNEKVRIIALRTKDGKMEAAIYEGVAKDISEKVKLVYKTYSLQELRMLLG